MSPGSSRAGTRQAVDHRLAAKVGADDDLEAERRRCSRNRGGVVGRLPELPVRGQIWVEIVADGQRDALLGRGRRGREAIAASNTTDISSVRDADRTD